MKSRRLSLALVMLLGSPAFAGERSVCLQAAMVEVEVRRGAAAVGKGVNGAPVVVRGQTMEELIEGLEENGGIVLSRPFLFTEEGKRASVHSGQRVAAGDGGDVRDVGMRLDVLPTADAAGGEITLELDYKNDRIIGEVEEAGATRPNISTQQISSRLKVEDGSVVVMGGIVGERQVERRVLGAIPGIKRLAGKRKAKFETVIILKPQLVDAGVGLDSLLQKKAD